MIKLAVSGAAGRMGLTILRLAACDKAFKIVGGLEQAKHPSIGTDIGVLLGQKPLKAVISSNPNDVLKKADVLIDFTHASVTKKTLAAVVKTKTAYVIGTTGLSKDVLKGIRTASKKLPVVQSPNMSIGVNLLFSLAQTAAKVLDESYDIEMTEIHHRHKKDSPSGTAMKLLEVVAAARKKNLSKDVLYGRKGDIGARPKGEIGVFALRGGDVVGDHNVSFLAEGERIELVHRASSREAFAKGSLTAAKFVAKRKKGLFDMQQVLGMA